MRPIPDDMLEAIAERMYERISTSSVLWNRAPLRVRNRYLNAAHSTLMLADMFWTDLGEKP